MYSCTKFTNLRLWRRPSPGGLGGLGHLACVKPDMLSQHLSRRLRLRTLAHPGPLLLLLLLLNTPLNTPLNTLLNTLLLLLLLLLPLLNTLLNTPLNTLLNTLLPLLLPLLLVLLGVPLWVVYVHVCLGGREVGG